MCIFLNERILRHLSGIPITTSPDDLRFKNMQILSQTQHKAFKCMYTRPISLNMAKNMLQLCAWCSPFSNIAFDMSGIEDYNFAAIETGWPTFQSSRAFILRRFKE